jgi:hypothetical protein
MFRERPAHHTTMEVGLLNKKYLPHPACIPPKYQGTEQDSSKDQIPKPDI